MHARCQRPSRAITAVSRARGAGHLLGQIAGHPGTLAEYDRLQPGHADLAGALKFLVEQGFFNQATLEEAQIWLAVRGGEGRTSSAVHRAATVVCNFKEWTPPT